MHSIILSSQLLRITQPDNTIICPRSRQSCALPYEKVWASMLSQKAPGLYLPVAQGELESGPVLVPKARILAPSLQIGSLCEQPQTEEAVQHAPTCLGMKSLRACRV